MDTERGRHWPAALSARRRTLNGADQATFLAFSKASSIVPTM